MKHSLETPDAMHLSIAGTKAAHLVRIDPEFLDAQSRIDELHIVHPDTLNGIVKLRPTIKRKPSGLRPTSIQLRTQVIRENRRTLREVIIGNHYFEIGNLNPYTVRVAAFVTDKKPNLMSTPVPDESARIDKLKGLFDNLSKLNEFRVEYEQLTLIRAQDTLVNAIRANVSRRDSLPLKVEEVSEIIAKNIQ